MTLVRKITEAEKRLAEKGVFIDVSGCVYYESPVVRLVIDGEPFLEEHGVLGVEDVEINSFPKDWDSGKPFSRYNLPKGDRWEADGASWTAAPDDNEAAGWGWRPVNLKAYKKAAKNHTPQGELMEHRPTNGDADNAD